MEGTYTSKYFTQSTDISSSTLNQSPDLQIQHLDPNDISLSQLTIEDEIEDFHIPPFFNITPRTIPKSPHYIIEEAFSKNPWALLITTIFLTKRSGKVAKPHLVEFFNKYPTPYDLLLKNPNEIEACFDKLGLRKRGEIIWKMTYQFVSARWRRTSDLYGIGKYGEDAHRLFTLGHFDVEPNDRYLRIYVNWLRNQTKLSEEYAIDDCDCAIEDPTLNYYSVTLQE